MTESKAQDIATIRDALFFFTESNVRHYSGSCACKRQDALVALGRLESLTHPEAQGNKDLEEPPLTRLEVRNAALKEAAEIAADYSLGYGTGDRFDAGHDSACKYIEKAIRALVLQGASAPAPTSPQPINGESELESASNGMGLR